MKKKIIYIVIIAMIASILQINTVKADTLTENWSKTFNLAKENVEALYDLAGATLGLKTEKGRKAIESCLSPLGFIVGYITISEQNFVDIFNMKNYGGVTIGGENATNEEVVDDVIDYIINNVSFEGNQITFGGDIKNLLNDYAEYVKNTEPWHYMYSVDISETTNRWSNGVVYNRVRDIIREHQDNDYVLYWTNTSSTNNDFVFWFIPKTDRVQFVKGYGHLPQIADYYTWEYIWNAGSSTVSANVYQFDGSTLTYVGNQSTYDLNGLILQETPDDSDIAQNGAYLRYALVTTNGHKDQVILWDSLEAMKEGSVGKRGYYVSDSYNSNIANSNNTYDSSNSNNITYGDVTNYINNYYGSNGENPTQPIINVYINNNIPSGSGGSGGSGGDSGGSGGDSGDLGIFDFLSRIGKVLGNLIKNLGNVLAELVEGLAETVNSLFESIPTVFNTFMKGVFSWLPTELLSIITLGIAAMILVGIIKIFKG